MKSSTVIICPGNGCSQIRTSNWYGQLYDILTNCSNSNTGGNIIRCICENFPDPLHARRDVWVPHIRSLAEKQASNSGDNIILVGHSSGAQAALRYAELYKVHGIVLVSATYSDLGDAHERASGYYPQKVSAKDVGNNGGGGGVVGETNQYLFEEMKKNCKHWHQFHSDDDPFIPLHEAEKIRDGLGLSDTYYMLPGRSHFFDYEPELLKLVKCSGLYNSTIFEYCDAVCLGNGCSQIRTSNWYVQLYDILTNYSNSNTGGNNIRCICENFPDPLHACRDVWVPHIRSLAEKQASNSGDNIILVGHSSGAQAALRYAELYKVHGIVLVSATYSDLGDAHERASGYYPQKASARDVGNNCGGGGVVCETNQYLFEEMKKNCKHWHQFHSDDDPFIPLHEAEKIRDGLGLSDT